LLPGNRNVGRIDATTGIYVFSEVGGRNWLKSLLSHQRNVGSVDTTARVDIAKKYTHGSRDGGTEVAG
jgi:hypothetical protein